MLNNNERKKFTPVVMIKLILIKSRKVNQLRNESGSIVYKSLVNGVIVVCLTDSVSA
ncbi:hypothetical protein HSX44_01025 [Wolbachia endosymbiont of Onchocerca gibsoni]|uniref:hypothetical protein n=1 Tax=Wolbachia endosymbiont of Onchocerca gibsoni TaxID=118986 RepID=UPI0023D885A5|nr:hypothetical protein [Wolbachia endosymbiont of Onchocerca gibsoni]MDF0607488.1 hypothetical protein [Wolbachia endosymbiont of Onchocerca gibsoni]